jgi:hypothetical protein
VQGAKTPRAHVLVTSIARARLGFELAVVSRIGVVRAAQPTAYDWFSAA